MNNSWFDVNFRHRNRRFAPNTATPRLEVLEARTLPSLFDPAHAFTAGSDPDGVAVADLNGDGKPDLVLANYIRNGSVSVLMGNGNGTFGNAVNFSVGAYPTAVAVGEFTGDGKPDLAVTNLGNGTVSVLLGNGNGTFQNAVNYPVGSAPHSVAVGDFSGDGKLDLAVANSDSNNVSVLRGNGNGTFQNAVNFAVGSFPAWVAVGDLTMDGKLDLVTANGFSANLSVLLGNGNGTFQSAINLPDGSGSGVGSVAPVSVAVGDFNGDGKPDLVAGLANSTIVSVLLGNGNGTFKNAMNYTGGGNVAVGDFNGDGKLDVASTDGNGNGVDVLLGNGNGTFQNVLNFPVDDASIARMAVGDLSGDGAPDLVVTDWPMTVSVLLNTATHGSTTAVVSSVDPAVFGQSVTFTATVSVNPCRFGHAHRDGDFPGRGYHAGHRYPQCRRRHLQHQGPGRARTPSPRFMAVTRISPPAPPAP